MATIVSWKDPISPQMPIAARARSVRHIAAIAALVLACATASAQAAVDLCNPAVITPNAANADAAATLGYATEQLGLRVRPRRINRLWAIEPQARDPAAEFRRAQAAGAVEAWLSELPPPHAPYRRLEAEGRRYCQIMEAGGWATLPIGAPLRPAAKHPTIAKLRLRLAAEGYALPQGPDAETLDPGLAEVLRAFQRRHALEPDAILGPETLRALNVPASARREQIEVNLERWRWLPRQLPATRIEVDSGAQEASYFDEGAERMRMRVIVGDPRHPTPMFASQLSSAVFNPPWNVPTSIANTEIWPKVARDPGYLRRHRMVRTANGLQQLPGPGNALGRIKFDFPSPFGVYLHDTPSRNLFARSKRTLSHGCVRLEKPRELAALLLARQGWTGALIDAAIEGNTTRRVELAAKIPLYVVYRTTSVDGDGWAVFRPDPYGWDAELLRALREAQSVAGGVKIETECSAEPSK